MRELLQRVTAPSAFNTQEMSPQNIRDHPSNTRQDSSCPSSCSQPAHCPNNSGILVPNGNPGYTNGAIHPYPRSVPDATPNQLSSYSLYDSPHTERRIPKRKRSCFEIRDDAVADFIDKKLITLDCAISCFNTLVKIRIDLVALDLTLLSF